MSLETTPSFKTHTELWLQEEEYEALKSVLVLIETGQLIHKRHPVGRDYTGRKFTGHFNMSRWATSENCGTVACIGGTTELISGVRLRPMPCQRNLYDLFYVRDITLLKYDLDAITPGEAGQA